MPKGRTVLFGLITVFSPLVSGRVEDIHAALQRPEDLEKAGRSKEAILIPREVLKSAPECSLAYLGVGRCHFVTAEYAKAAASFEKGLQLRPSEPEIINWLGRGYLKEKHPHLAGKTTRPDGRFLPVLSLTSS